MKKLIFIVAMVAGVVQFASACVDNVKGASDVRLAQIEAISGE